MIKDLLPDYVKNAKDKHQAIKDILITQCSDAIKQIKHLLCDYVNTNDEKRKAMKTILLCRCNDVINTINETLRTSLN